MNTKETNRRPGTAPHPAGTGRQPASPRRSSVQGAPPRKRPAQRKPQEVVYTPGKPFNRNRLFLQLAVVAAVVLAIFGSLSLFFKVKVDHKDRRSGEKVTTVLVSGNEKYSASAIIQASGIRDGDSLLSVNSAKIGGQIIAKLPYVESVRVGIKLPDTVNIEVEELDVVYAVTDTSGGWWFMTSEGRLVEMTDATSAAGYTKIKGIQLDLPIAGQQAVAVEPTQEPAEEGEETTEEPPAVITNAQRLETALSILQYLESNDILGEVVSVDVTNMGNVEMQYAQRFRILLGDPSRLEYKVNMAVAAVNQLKDYDRGTLDVSFMAREEVVYTPDAD